MRRSGRLLIVLGAGLAIVAIALVLVVLLAGDTGSNGDDDSVAQEADEPQEITVMSAAREVPAHTVLTQDDLTEMTVQSDQVAGDPIQSSAEVVGLAYGVDLVEGQVLLQSEVETPGLANSIDPGRRAFALPVNSTNLLGGLIRDDDHVDIIFNVRAQLTGVVPSYPLELEENLELGEIEDQETEEGVEIPGVTLPEYGQPPQGPTYPYPGEEGSRFWISDMEDGDVSSKIMLQNVRIIRVLADAEGAEAGTDAESGDYLILDLDPVEAELVRFMTETGSYQVMLRSSEDQEQATTPGVTMNTLVDNWDLLAPKTVQLPGSGTE